MLLDPAQLPDDIAALKALLIAADKRAVAAEARASDLDGEIETLSRPSMRSPTRSWPFRYCWRGWR